MNKLITLAAVLVAVACNKDKPAPTIPASVLPEDSQDREMSRTSPTGEPVSTGPTSAEIEAEEAEAPPEEAITQTPLVVETAPTNDTLFVDPGAAEPVAVGEVIAVLGPTRGNKVHGTVSFRAVEGGLEVTADVVGLPRGPHAFHVHVFGDCTAPDATSAGDHFHFTGSSTDPNEPVIIGNLGELNGDNAGKARVTTTVEGATLQGKFSILGRSVVVHEKGNDPTHPPDGAAGKRLACGVIGVRQAEPAAGPPG